MSRLSPFKVRSRLIIQALTVLVLLMGLFAGICAAEQLSPREQRVLYQAYELLGKGRPKACVDLLDRSLSPESAPAQWFILRGNALLELDREDEARSTFEHGLENHPGHELLHHNHAVACYVTEDWEAAAESFVKAFELGQESSPDLLYNAATAYAQAGEARQGLGLLEELFQHHPSPSSAWLELGVNLCLQEENPVRAERFLDILVQRTPGRNQYWRLMARVHLEQEDLPAAASALEIAYALQDTENSRWKELAHLYQAMNAPLSAARRLEKGAGADPDLEECREIAAWYARAFRHDEAVAWMDRALEVRASAPILAEKAKILYRFGRFEQAIQSAEQALEQDGQLGSMAMLVGLASSQLQDWQRAETAFARAEKIKGTRHQARAFLASIRTLLRSKAQGEHHTSGHRPGMEIGG